MLSPDTENHATPNSGGTDARARITAIRAEVMPLSPTFHAAFMEWFSRIAQDSLTEQDSQRILNAVADELQRLEDERAEGRMNDFAVANGHISIRALLTGMAQQSDVTRQTKVEIQRILADRLSINLLDVPGYRITHDWFHFHEDHWRKHFGYFSGRPNLRFLEIGSFEGRSACWMLSELLTAPGCQLICVDTFDLHPGQESNFDHNIHAVSSNATVLKLRGRSQQVLHHIEEQSIDFIYVDGSHSALDIIADAAAAWRLARTGAVLVFDDYANDVLPDSFAMPCKVATDAFLAMIEGRYELIFKDWQVAISKRI